MKRFSINLTGRVKNFNLPKNKPLLPLFEAIVNSIHSIEERKQYDNSFSEGVITIKSVRDSQMVLSEVENSLQEIVGFIIEDNGMGFNERNLNSFMESDSTYKADKGGKGVGRFSWLKAFEKASICSVYIDDGEYVKRSFEFSASNPEIDDSLEDCQEVNGNLTTVSLENYKTEYRQNLPKNGETIAIKIIQHCLVYFLSKDCPKIFFDDDGERFFLNKIFNETIKTDENEQSFNINGKVFTLLNVKMEEASLKGSKLYLCANNRVVDEKELDKSIIDLDKQIFEKHQFYYVGVLTSEYLDNNVDMNRLSFNIPDKGSDLLSDVSLEQIMEISCSKIEEYLKDYLDPIKKEKQLRICRYVTEEAPQFRHLLKYMPTEISKIKPNLSDDKLDDELHQIKRKFDKGVKADNKKLLEKIEKGFDNDYEYKQLFEKQICKISEANKAELANYVAHRKIIISLLENGIRKNDSEKFNKESYVHNLIYPMRTTSDDIDYENHNLWLIDEKLAYCTFISSDIPFNNDNKEERTDIMILDNPVAVSDDENDGSEFDTIVLFELKRPMRDNYSISENPVTQLYEYVEKIKAGKAKDKYGRTIKVGNGTKFYLYAVCDITPSLEKTIRFNSFKHTPDNMGYYLFNDTYNAYVEILSFSKIIKDSKKRNRILFDKLGI
ncbi:ATP-binding protein [Clostridium botulinum]|uniref:ATP-binding protein n=1 Tax=Clostridium botulinum TaxID=1491 RepID=UPI000A175E25|nr:ATP-binding protein [Clostridium botulinum]OSA80964.1 ATP-binding protein [Clostridium botulinum]